MTRSTFVFNLVKPQYPYPALPCFHFNRLVWFLMASLVLILALPLQGIAALPKEMVSAGALNPYESLSLIEKQVYQKAYPRQTLEARLQRLEKTLGLSPLHAQKTLSLRQRLNRLDATIKSQREEWENYGTERTLSFLENRLFGMEYSRMPLEARLAQLEQWLFQQIYDDLPEAQRLERISARIPVSGKGVRLSISEADDATTAQRDLYQEIALPKQQVAGLRLPQPQPKAKTEASLSQSESLPLPDNTEGNRLQKTEVNAVAPALPFDSAGFGVSPAAGTTRAAYYSRPVPEPVQQWGQRWGHQVAASLQGKDKPPAPFELASVPARLPAPLSSGTYLAALESSRAGLPLMRWQELPVRIWNNDSSPQAQQYLAQLLTLWQEAVPMQVVNEPDLAHIWFLSQPIEQSAGNFSGSHSPQQILNLGVAHKPVLKSYSSLSAPGLLAQTNVITEPVLVEWPGEGFRTVVIIKAYSRAQSLNTMQRFRLLAQQIGYSLGLWGFSPYSTDLMFPRNDLEKNALPEVFHNRQNILQTWLRDFQEPVNPIAIGPSSRDIATLRQLYHREAENISRFDPVRLQANESSNLAK